MHFDNGVRKNTNSCFLYGRFYLAIRLDASGYFIRKMKSWHRHLGVSIGVGIGIGIAKNLCLPYKSFFEKVEHLRQHTQIVFFVVSYSAPVSLCYSYSSLYDLLFINLQWPTGVLEKRLFEFSEAPAN